MLPVDEFSSSAMRAPLEIIEPIARENALPVSPTHTMWVAGSGERSGVVRFRNRDFLNREYSWVFAGVSGPSVDIEEKPRLGSSPTGHWVQSLSAEMQQFQVRTETEISRLSSAIESLTRTVAAIHRDAVDDVYGLPVPAFDPSHAAEASDHDLATALNCIADLKLSWSPEWAVIAQEKLSAESPKLRAASARAIAAHDSDLANSLLPARMEAEPNKFVRSVLRSALAAASA